jgi:hypothetical protein
VLTLPGKRTQRAVSLIILILVGSWCALKWSVWAGIYSYYVADPSGAQIAGKAHFFAWFYLGSCLVAICLAAWVLPRTLGDSWSEMIPTVKYLLSLLISLIAVGGTVAAASILIKHLSSGLPHGGH